MSLVSQLVTTSDWKQYKEIRLEALQKEPQAFGSSYNREKDRTEEEWRDKLSQSENSQGKSFFYAVSEGKNFVAMGGAYQDENDEWNIISIYTKKEYRGRGLGQTIISSIIGELKDRQIKRAYLSVNSLQKTAQRLYEKNGFIITRVIKDQLLGDGSYYNEVEMMIDNL